MRRGGWSPMKAWESKCSVRWFGLDWIELLHNDMLLSFDK